MFIEIRLAAGNVIQTNFPTQNFISHQPLQVIHKGIFIVSLTKKFHIQRRNHFLYISNIRPNYRNPSRHRFEDRNRHLFRVGRDRQNIQRFHNRGWVVDISGHNDLFG